MSSAAPSTNAPIAHPAQLFIDGQWKAPSGATLIDVIDSGTEELFFRVAEADPTDVHRAVTAARRAFDEGPWPRLTHAQRAAYLTAIGAEMKLRAADAARIWTIESGITHALAQSTTSGVGGIYAYYAGMAQTFPFVERKPPDGGRGAAYLVQEPVGVVAAIIPWNGPPLLLAYKCAPALLAGCTLVIKASPEAPGAAYLLAEICEKVGLPPGVVNVLTADRTVSESLVRHPGVDKVAFTGSTAAGRRIASICGERIARVTLELGGKSAAVVLDDYDVARAAESIARSAAFLTGQVCASLTRIIVTRARHAAMVDALSAAFAGVRVGDPFDQSTHMGPLASCRQRDRVEGYIAKGKAEGATLVTGGGRPRQLARGFFIEPTVFGNVSNDATIAREEIFGPVLSVIPARDEADAIRIANDTIYGLNAAVFTDDLERAWSVARQLRSGTVGHNRYRTDWTVGFGGFKQSGIGREGGTQGVSAFLESKTILLDGAPGGVAAP
jgi:acyl-CoA reductase-like NAD-dependent aldehyde dehydrogenase